MTVRANRTSVDKLPRRTPQLPSFISLEVVCRWFSTLSVSKTASSAFNVNFRKCDWHWIHLWVSNRRLYFLLNCAKRHHVRVRRIQHEQLHGPDFDCRELSTATDRNLADEILFWRVQLLHNQRRQTSFVVVFWLLWQIILSQVTTLHLVNHKKITKCSLFLLSFKFWRFDDDFCTRGKQWSLLDQSGQPEEHVFRRRSLFIFFF